MKHGDRVKLNILDTGMQLWAKGIEPSASRIASELGITHGAVFYHFNSLFKLREAIAVHAVRKGNSGVIVQLIGLRHPSVAALGDLERMAHVRACVDH